ncbi:MAG: hypothetical protein GXP55_26500 [Deltaproteobacteria bacterium]|nr:hypothetical protein [Deltaproteobacteria bacterium]
MRSAIRTDRRTTTASARGAATPPEAACARAATAGGALAPVCGCDGVTYTNTCWAQAVRTRVAHDGMCD